MLHTGPLRRTAVAVGQEYLGSFKAQYHIEILQAYFNAESAADTR